MNSSEYRNPVIPGYYPDPSVCRVGDDFYLVTSSFEYFPGIPVFHSTDLLTWHQIGHALTRTSQLELTGAPASGGIYAPTLRWHDGTFYITGTNVSGHGGHFIVHATDPAGPWSEPVWVDQNGIDPSLFFDGDTCYFTSNVEPDPSGEHVANPDFTRGAQQSVVDPLTGERLSDVQFLWAGTGGRYPEAPHMYRRGDYFYLMLAEGGTGTEHMVTVARSDSPWGPWEPCPRNPVLSHRSLPHPFQSIGHADLVELADGSWWAVALGTRPVGGHHHLGRETFLVAVEWDESGWPVFGDGGTVPESARRPELPSTPGERIGPDPFSGPLGLEWVTLRRPLDETSIRPGLGGLRMVGGPDTMDDKHPVFLGRRQQHHACEVEAVLEFEPGPHDEAGLTVRMNEKHHADVLVRQGDHGRTVALRVCVGPFRTLTSPVDLADGPVRLRLEARPDTYAFSAVDAGGQVVDLGSLPTKFLSTEVAGGFTGVMVGPYATGDGTTASAVATWRSFDYRPE